MNGAKYCSVIGCSRKYSLKIVANPFALDDPPITLCERCLRAGTEAVKQGKSELTQDIYEKYYISYPKSEKEIKELDRNEAIHQQMGVDGWQEIYADAPSEEDIRQEMAEN